MHSLISTFSIFCLMTNPEYKHDSIPLLPDKVYRVTINPIVSGRVQGYLQNLTDSTITISDFPVKYMGNSQGKTIPYADIKDFKYHRQGSIGRGILYGVIGGAILGGIVGAASYSKCENCFFDFGIGLNIVAGSILGIIPGAGIGLLLGSKNQKVFINGRKERVYTNGY
jgi:hypothetical protein